jgi:hypothetical protein
MGNICLHDLDGVERESRDAVSFVEAETGESPGQAIGPFVQLAVRPALFFADDGGLVGIFPRIPDYRVAKGHLHPIILRRAEC